ncbi:uncharacterized protein OCT59_010001 [Rhizophagus irregularis]|uniref:uncharacterized protein n=1 Tax=Rhizophagus irregularis TaxID=588596 RepID=UPI00331B4406|nr:hypothetical protein OCT59_010001 [Rhizophagus irregularis]
MEMTHDIRIVVGIDFGVKHSTFAYAYKSTPSKIFVYNRWGFIGQFKTPTVLKYDESFNLISWGYSALSQKPNRKKKSFETKPVENFLLYLSQTNYEPYLPEGLHYKKAITDYLKEMGNFIKETLMSYWPYHNFFENVLIIMPIPAEYNDKAIAIMRECAYNACLINEKDSLRLQFITKHEAASVHCINVLREYNISDGSTFIMIVDCGSGTVELTTQKLLENHKLGEITERSGDYCGGYFVDDEFINFLGRKVGSSAIDHVRNNHCGQLQYMIQEFCGHVKFPFTGQQEDFIPFDLDLELLCPAIKQYIKGSELDEMENMEWIIDLNFDDVKAMFDPVIERILQLIRTQLNAIRSCEAMILVGGFSQSKYLQRRIKQEFNQRNINIIIPAIPSITIVKGGVKVTRKWNSSDPIELKLSDGMINSFLRIAKRGDEIPSDTGISMIFSSSFISRNNLDLFVTDEHNVKYCNSPGVNLIGTLKIHTPSTFNNNAISITLFFDDTTIKVVAQEVDVKIGWKHETVLDNIY